MFDPIKSSYWLICLVLLAYSSLISAHAVVTETSFTINTIKPGIASTVTINYNSKIEPGLSQIFLVSKGDKQIKLDFQSSTKPGQIKVQLPELIPGKYALRFKVFAADGHLTEDLIHFQVK